MDNISWSWQKKKDKINRLESKTIHLIKYKYKSHPKGKSLKIINNGRKQEFRTGEHPRE